MKPTENKKSVYYITVDRIVTTREYYAIKHNNLGAAETLAIKGKVKPFYYAQLSNHRKHKFTMELPATTTLDNVIDGEAINDKAR